MISRSRPALIAWVEPKTRAGRRQRMTIKRKLFIEMSERYKTGIGIVEHDGIYFLASIFEDKDGHLDLNWAYPQKFGKPVQRAFPWQLELGKSIEEAEANLEKLLGMIAILKGDVKRPAIEDEAGWGEF